MPGNQAHAEQLEIIHTRYRLAGEHAEERDVLEVACGPGRALGYLAGIARSVVGGDYTAKLAAQAYRTHGGRVPIVRLDGQFLPFRSGTFDLVLLFEALYYLADPTLFAQEAARVLRPGGELIISCSNPELPDFIPSPFHTQYLPADELRALLVGAGFEVQMFVGFEAPRRQLRHRVIGTLRRIAARFDLTPRSMAGKAWLKRLFYGELQILGDEIETAVPTRELTPHRGGAARRHRLIYAVARRPSGSD